VVVCTYSRVRQHVVVPVGGICRGHRGRFALLPVRRTGDVQVVVGVPGPGQCPAGSPGSDPDKDKDKVKEVKVNVKVKVKFKGKDKAKVGVRRTGDVCQTVMSRRGTAYIVASMLPFRVSYISEFLRRYAYAAHLHRPVWV